MKMLIRNHREERWEFSARFLNINTNWPLKIPIIVLTLFFVIGCSGLADIFSSDDEPVIGCDGQTYIKPSESPYILPYFVGQTYKTGLSNCSSSFHSPGNPDQYAYDFDMPLGSYFIAARGGTVLAVVENNPGQTSKRSDIAIVGNYVIIDHGDDTYGLYLHSPKDGIIVEENDTVKRGDVLGITGSSGLAGYPHLHFIVVKDSPQYPYDGIAISFRNASPQDVPLKSYTEYKAVSY